MEVYFNSGDLLFTSTGWKDPNSITVGDVLYRSRDSLTLDKLLDTHMTGVTERPDLAGPLGPKFVQVTVLSLSARKVHMYEVRLGHRDHGFVVSNISRWDESDDKGLHSYLSGLEVVDDVLRDKPHTDTPSAATTSAITLSTSALRYGNVEGLIPGVSTPNTLGRCVYV